MIEEGLDLEKIVFRIKENQDWAYLENQEENLEDQNEYLGDQEGYLEDQKEYLEDQEEYLQDQKKYLENHKEYLEYHKKLQEKYDDSQEQQEEHQDNTDIDQKMNKIIRGPDIDWIEVARFGDSRVWEESEKRRELNEFCLKKPWVTR